MLKIVQQIIKGFICTFTYPDEIIWLFDFLFILGRHSNVTERVSLSLSQTLSIFYIFVSSFLAVVRYHYPCYVLNIFFYLSQRNPFREPLFKKTETINKFRFSVVFFRIVFYSVRLKVEKKGINMIERCDPTLVQVIPEY